MSDIEELEVKKKRLELERSIKILETQKNIVGAMGTVKSKITKARVVKVAAIWAVLITVIIIMKSIEWLYF